MYTCDFTFLLELFNFPILVNLVRFQQYLRPKSYLPYFSYLPLWAYFPGRKIPVNSTGKYRGWNLPLNLGYLLRRSKPAVRLTGRTDMTIAVYGERTCKTVTTTQQLIWVYAICSANMVCIIKMFSTVSNLSPK